MYFSCQFISSLIYSQDNILIGIIESIDDATLSLEGIIFLLDCDNNYFIIPP